MVLKKFGRLNLSDYITHNQIITIMILCTVTLEVLN